MPAAQATRRRRPQPRPRCRPHETSRCSQGSRPQPVRTTRMLIGTCRAEPAGSRSTSCAMPSDTATSNPTVKPVRASASPIATRDENTENDSRTALQRRENAGSYRHLDHHHRRQRSEHRRRHTGDNQRQPPRQPGRQPRLGHRADLGRGRRCPRHRVSNATPPPPHPTVHTTRRLRPHCRTVLPWSDAWESLPALRWL